MSRIKQKDKIDESRLPDGGWGWMVVLGVALTNMFNQSLVSVFGLLFGERLEEMGHGTAGIALVSNLNNMVMCFSGLMTGPVLRRYTCRQVSVFGSLLASTGLVMCSFASGIIELLIFYSFLTGVGLGLIYPATFVAIKGYFVEKRGRAVGLSMAGTGIGQMLMPQLVRILLDEYGFTWCIRIIGVLCLHGAVGSLLYQPVNWHLKPGPVDTEKLLNNNDIALEIEDEKQKSTKERKISILSTQEENITTEKALKNHEEDTSDDQSTSDSKPWYNRLVVSLQLQLLLEPSFSNLCAGLALVHTAGVAFMMIFPFFLMEGHVLRFSRSDTALFMSVLSGADIVARLTVPSITHYAGLNSRTTFMWGALLLAGARTLIAWQKTFGMMLAASILCGYIRAITVINQNLSVSEYCSTTGIDEKLPAALGLMMVSKGAFVICVGQLLGWLRDYTMSYPLFIHGSNTLLVIVFISWFTELLGTRMKGSSCK